MDVMESLQLLGMPVEDKVTGFKGVVASVSFDLYGCIQAVVNPGMDKDGKLKDSCWFDVARLTVTSKKPVMERPDFVIGLKPVVKGPAAKPSYMKP